ncbi:hypothetical protein I4U23_008788 [Adineta vaga]|nr:hypothetical protein I4U23_008788 [Adineta vaga]
MCNGQEFSIRSSSFNKQTNLQTNRIFISTKSNRIFQKKTIDSIDHILSTSEKTLLHTKRMQSSNIASLSGKQQLGNQESTNTCKLHIMINPADHTSTLNHEQYLSSSSSSSSSSSAAAVRLNNEHQSLSTSILTKHIFRNRNQTVTHSSHQQIEQPLLSSSSSSSLLSQLIPDSIINGKQATNRIFNERNSTPYSYLSKRIILTPIYFSSRKTSELKTNNEEKSINRTGQYYQIASLFTSTSTFLMHQNEVIAHATASDPFLSDTIFIIIIATLTILILLFCFGLFCLCRRTTKRNISPSFDGGTYSGLYGQSFVVPMDDNQQEFSPYEHDVSPSPINHPSVLNDRIVLPQTVALHHTAKQKAHISQNKLKKKRAGFCCCNSNRTPSTVVNTQTRIKRNQI